MRSGPQRNPGSNFTTFVNDGTYDTTRDFGNMSLNLGRTLAIILLSSTVQTISAANILILCFPLFGHINGPANVGKVLQDQGHDVTLAIPTQMQSELEDKGLKFLLYSSLGDLNVGKELRKCALDTLLDGGNVGFDILRTVSEKIARDRQFHQDILALKPDLIMLDSTPPARVLTIVAYILDVPFLFIGTAMQNQFARSPLLPSAVPNPILGFTDQMTFRQRLVNTLLEALFCLYDPVSFYPSIVKMVAPEKPYISIQDLQAKALLWIITQDGILDYNGPIMPNVKQVSHLLPTLTHQPLSDDFQHFMDNAKDGVVVVSFGSILDSVPSEIFTKLVTAFRLTKYKFVIRHSKVNSSENDKFLFSGWLSQFKLLQHKNTRLFITHCGANGQQEAVYSGVPMIGFPIFAEQPHNAARIVRKGFGLRMDLRTFVVEDLVSAIEEVITNPKYKDCVRKASAIMRAERVPGVEEAAFWVDHVLTFGADHLRSYGQDIPLWQYLSLDVLAFCLLVWHIFLFVSIKMVYMCYHWCCKRNEKIKKH